MKSGAIDKFRVTIDGKDVTEGVIGVQIFEDIQSPTWSAQIQFSDAADLIGKLPIKDGSVITVMVGTKHGVSTDGKKTYTFSVYRISDKMQVNQKQVNYTIYAVTREFLVNQTSRVIKTFKNKKMTDAIRDIVAEKFPGAVVIGKSCDNNNDLIIPSWTPFNSIGWCIKSAHVNNVADYLFFQSEDKEYTLESIAKLWNDPIQGITFRMRPGEVTQDPENVFNILKFENKHADSATNLTSGYHGNTMKTFDFMAKKWDTKTHVPKSDNNSSDALYKTALDSHVTFKAKHTNLTSGTNPADDADIWLQSRFAALQTLEQEKLIIQVAGTMGLYKLIGKNVTVEMPIQDATTPILFSSLMDRKRTGKYMVTAISHYINQQSYVCNLELVKKEKNK